MDLTDLVSSLTIATMKIRPPFLWKTNNKLTRANRERIRSAIRKIWAWSSEARKAVKNRSRANLGGYKCDMCDKFSKKIEIDHIDPVGPIPGSRNARDDYTWDEFIIRLFCDEDNLRALCKPCHKIAGAEQRKLAAEKRKLAKESNGAEKTKPSKRVKRSKVEGGK